MRLAFRAVVTLLGGALAAVLSWTVTTADAFRLQSLHGTFSSSCYVLVVVGDLPYILAADDVERFVGENPQGTYTVAPSRAARLNAILRDRGNPAYPASDAAWRFRLLRSSAEQQRVEVEVWGDQRATVTTYAALATQLRAESVKVINWLDGATAFVAAIIGGTFACSIARRKCARSQT
jgi:hypothetical protein